MRFLFTVLVGLTLLSLCGCKPATDENEHSPAAIKQSTASPQQATPGLAGSSGTGARTTEVSLAQVDAVQSSNIAAERKIIRNANLTIEIDSPADGMHKAAEIAQAHGGFVVNSEFTDHGGRAQGQPSQTVTVALRVPSSQFEQALDSIRKIGNRVLQDKVTGQDVTEEYLDLEVRIRTKRALEAQFLEIMKQAKKVSEALEVQRELAEVRTEIERLEGRRRFLENQSTLSTINVTLQMPVPIVAANTTSFLGSIRGSLGDGVDTGASIILGLIRLIILLIPVGLFIILPIGLLVRLVLRRFNWQRNEAAGSVNITNE
jgi:hypothetical protein